MKFYYHITSRKIPHDLLQDTTRVCSSTFPRVWKRPQKRFHWFVSTIVNHKVKIPTIFHSRNRDYDTFRNVKIPKTNSLLFLTFARSRSRSTQKRGFEGIYVQLNTVVHPHPFEAIETGMLATARLVPENLKPTRGLSPTPAPRHLPHFLLTTAGRRNTLRVSHRQEDNV